MKNELILNPRHGAFDGTRRLGLVRLTLLAQVRVVIFSALLTCSEWTVFYFCFHFFCHFVMVTDALVWEY